MDGQDLDGCMNACREAMESANDSTISQQWSEKEEPEPPPLERPDSVFLTKKMLNITETESSSSESVSDEDKEYVPQTSEESDGSSDEEPLKVPNQVHLQNFCCSLLTQTHQCDPSAVPPQNDHQLLNLHLHHQTAESHKDQPVQQKRSLKQLIQPGTKFPKKKME
ncbi:unnamed protein product [Gadus morhua 'NCC']